MRPVVRTIGEIVTPCSIHGCLGDSRARGLCALHYARLLRLGTPELPPRPSGCTVLDCTRTHYGRGYCTLHCYRLLRSGNPGPASTRKPGYLAWKKAFIARHPPKDGIGRVPLKPGKAALVDAEDYPRVVAHNWTYRSCGLQQKSEYAFRAIVRGGTRSTEHLGRFVLGIEGKMRVSFKNHDGLDCRKDNLLLCRKKQFVRHRRGWRMHTSSYKGVSWQKTTHRWVAQITLQGKVRYLGLFGVEEEAARAYDQAASKAFGVNAYLNFPGRE